jgi:hypothetical protein
MASTYSTNLKIELIGTGEQAGTWGTTTNTNLGTALEQAVVGKADVTMSSTTITLTLTNANTAQDARAIYLNLTGSPGGAAVLEVPAIQKPYIVKNGSDQQVTIKVSGQTGVAIPTGKTALVYNNGTDVVTAVDFIPEIATTTVDTTNIEVTNIKAKDGTSAGSIADSTGVVTLASSVLTTTDINGGTIDGAVIGGASAAAGSFTTLNTSGQVVFNDAGADVDFRVEGDTDANLLFVDASTDRVGIGTNTPASKLHIQANANAISVDDGLSVRNSNSGSSAGARIALGNDVGTAPGLQLASSTNTTFGANALTVYQNLSAPVTFWTNNTERMRIDSSGNVGIGTTSPSTALHINRASGETLVRTEVAANSEVGFDIVKTGATNQHWRIADGSVANGTLEIYDVTNSRSNFRTSSTQSVFNENGADIDFRVEGDTDANLLFVDASADRVAIGNTSPQAKLHVGSDTTGPGFGTVAQMVYNAGSIQPEFCARQIPNSVVCSFYADATGGHLRTATNHTLVFETNNVSRMSIASGGAVNVVGALSKGSGSFKGQPLTTH